MKAQHLDRAVQLAPIVERVHGANHPELRQVRELTQALKQAGDHASASKLYAKLREVTNNYALPADACEAFTAAYTSLKSADAAHASRDCVPQVR